MNALRVAGGKAVAPKHERQGRPPELITLDTVKRLAAETSSAKDRYIQDTDVPGFKLLRRAGGELRMAYVFMGKVNGKLVKKVLTGDPLTKKKAATVLANARAEAEDYYRAARKGRNLVAENKATERAARTAEAARRLEQEQTQKRAAWTMEHALEQMIAWRRSRPDEKDRLRPKSEAFYREQLRNLGRLAKKPTSEIRTDDVRAAIDKIKTAPLRAKARRAASAIIEYADRSLGLERRNPVSMLQRKEYARAKPRTDFIPESKLGEWIQNVRAATNRKDPRLAKTASNLALTLLLYGMRREEAAAMQWSWIDETARTFTIPANIAKTKEPRVLPLTPDMQAILDAQRKLNREHVFPGRKRGTGMRDIRTAMESAGCHTRTTKQGRRAFSYHDLRRTFSTHFTMQVSGGVRVKMVMGHADKDVTEEYIQAELGQIRRDLVAYHQWLRGVVFEHQYWQQHPDAAKEAAEEAAREEAQGDGMPMLASRKPSTNQEPGG